MSRDSHQQGPFDKAAKTLYNRLWAVAKKADGRTGGPAMQRLKREWAAGVVGTHLGADALADYQASLAASEPPEVLDVRALEGDVFEPGAGDQHKADLALLDAPRPAPGTEAFRRRDAARKRVAHRRSKLAHRHELVAVAAG